MISSSFKMRCLSVILLLPVTLFVIYMGGMVFKVGCAIAFGIAIKEWLRMARQSKNIIRDAVMGSIYILIGFYAFILLRTEFEQGLFFTIVLLFGVWASDSFAYFSGKRFGGAKMAPKISPNKTWAGLIGGTLGSAFVVLALDYFGPMIGAKMGLEISQFAPLVLAFIIGALFTIFGQIGDLAMSFYKRRVGVKDTGTLIPGHGGILDRIDSLLLVTPFFLFVLWALAG